MLKEKILTNKLDNENEDYYFQFTTIDLKKQYETKIELIDNNSPLVTMKLFSESIH